MGHCTNCGNYVSEDWSFCSKCGKALDRITAEGNISVSVKATSNIIGVPCFFCNKLLNVPAFTGKEPFLKADGNNSLMSHWMANDTTTFMRCPYCGGENRLIYDA